MMLAIINRLGRRCFPSCEWIGGLLALLVLLFTGCASTAAQVAGHVPQPSGRTASYVLPFEHGNGSVTVIADDNTIQFVVRAVGLEQGDYEIVLTTGNGGAMFGTGNTHVQLGEMHGETVFRTSTGELLLWSVHPRRLVERKDTSSISVRRAGADKAVVAQTGPLHPLP